MTRQICFGVLLLLSFCSIAQQKIQFIQPPLSPEVFAPGVICTNLNERDFALSPDGNELFYTLQSQRGQFQTILHRKKNKQGDWSKPEIAPFAGRFSDLEPAFSADGKKIFFASNRPLSGKIIKDYDIWVVEKKGDRWGEPENLGSPVNTPENEFYPSVAKTGNLYFTAAYKSSIGREDIMVAKWENGKYKEPVSLDSAINTKADEFNAFVSPDEEFIIFSSYGRKDDKGRGDLYMSIKDDLGNWLPAKNLAVINSDNIDYCPYVSPDKKAMYFTSERNDLQKSYPDKPIKANDFIKLLNSSKNGGGDIYWINFDKVKEYVR
jgi:Tol biopolymer transport system component